jgi:dTDP-4-dehydrorhamnose 3,5-epimerase
MRFEETPVPGAFVVELDRLSDERGWFARSFDRSEFERRGLEPAVVQCNVSYNERAGTLRGMHYQSAPHGEPKLVRATRGAIFDVIADVREDSPAYRAWFGVELSADNGRALYIPVGVAHGFQTLADATEVSYQMGHEYVADSAAGVRWDDPQLGIEWPPAERRIISERDLSYPPLAPGAA